MLMFIQTIHGLRLIVELSPNFRMDKLTILLAAIKHAKI